MAGAVGNSRKNNWVLIIILLCGIVLGGFIGTLASNVGFLSWRGYGKTFGLTSNAATISAPFSYTYLIVYTDIFPVPIWATLSFLSIYKPPKISV